MKQFSILDIRFSRTPAGRGKCRADVDCPAAGLDACRLSGSVLPANASCSCGFLSQPY